MTLSTKPPETSAGPPPRRPGELGVRELARWAWRQVTSMRTALVLLLLLALAAVPGSVIPQAGVDSLAVNRWKQAHPTLTPIYERLDLFSVYSSIWFSAIYLLLAISLVGCIVPRTVTHLRNARSQPPAAPRNLGRLPDHRTITTTAHPDEVLARARAVLGRRYRLRADDGGDAVSAEKGYLREVGNLVFHIAVVVVLAGFAVGGLYGYQGGVIVVKGDTFSNVAASYDDFDPGTRFGSDDLDPFQFTVDDFDVTWLTSGPSFGSARKFSAPLTYRASPGAPEQHYDLRVNHPLKIDDTDLFLIGHGYAPIITVRDGNGDVAWSGPTVFLPQDDTFLSFGVVKAASARPGQIGLEGLFYPTFQLVDGDPVTLFPRADNPLVSLSVFTGDLGLDTGRSQSIYLLDTSKATQVTKADGKPVRLDLREGETQQLPDGLGSVSFDGIQPWVKIQVSKTPGKLVALTGVVLALVGLLGSLFVRSRRVWVRARRTSADGDEDAGVTMVEVGVLDRSGGADLAEVLDQIVAELELPAVAGAGATTSEEDA